MPGKRGNRQNGDNKARFRRMVDSLDFFSDHGEEPLTHYAVASAIKEADMRTMDTRTVNRWILRLMDPPRSVWKGEPVLVPTVPVRGLTQPNGEPNNRALRRCMFKVQLPGQATIELVMAMEEAGRLRQL